METLFVEKKDHFAFEAKMLKKELEGLIGKPMESLRIVHQYYRDEPFSEKAVKTIFSEPLQDDTYDKLPLKEGERVLRLELLPGQFDQREYWAHECLKLMGDHAPLHYSTHYLFKGLSDEDFFVIKNNLINPVESMEVDQNYVSKPIRRSERDPSFDPIDLSEDSAALIASYDLAMSVEDLDLLKEQVDHLNFTELKMIDTYWSDHCRHTTFMTELRTIDFSENTIDEAKSFFELYQEKKLQLKPKPISLMDLAQFSMRLFLASHEDHDIEISEEINACSIERSISGNRHLIMFKNETHNHPTEIEPYGGAATCLGGAIRDPLSGRSYVYQSMRITGARDPRIDQTLPGKLSQRDICLKSAEGFSSYGNQIGLATGHVREFYHPGFEAKRMEVGFVIGAASREHVRRGEPKPGDLLLLAGGATGIDGIGGASGSSKSHHRDVVSISSSEVQKGNATEERKLQRFFREEAIGKRIIRCNDFGAGGISVAFGEISDGLRVDLSKIPLKYHHIHPWELAISESQERMAIVIDPKDLDLFNEMAKKQNLRIEVVGVVTDDHHFTLTLGDRVLARLDRDFLNSAGATRSMDLKIKPVELEDFKLEINDLTRAKNPGLIQHFDHSVGGLNLLNPFGGRYKKSFVDGMVSFIPGFEKTGDVTISTSGYDPYLSAWSPFHGAEHAVVLSIAKNLVLGGSLKGQRLSFQEYFGRLGDDAYRWSEPFMALLGANRVCESFGVPSIGGKDSMSGTFFCDETRMDVPPTLISFSVDTSREEKVISPDLKDEESVLVVFEAPKNDNHTYDLEGTKKNYQAFEDLRERGLILAASVIEKDPEDTLYNMGIGNGIGFTAVLEGDQRGSIIAQVKESDEFIGTIGGESYCLNGKELSIDHDPLRSIYKTYAKEPAESQEKTLKKPLDVETLDQVRVLIPVFPGTNSEDDLKICFEEAGAQVELLIFNNQSGSIEESLQKLAEGMKRCHVLALAGGFSAADEPEGSAKFIATVFRNELVKEAFEDLLKRGGYVLGICNGFQALVKLGVFHNRGILKTEQVRMSLTNNVIGRHQAAVVRTRIDSVNSPWLAGAELGDEVEVAISHGEGNFICDGETLNELKEKGQIFSRYLVSPNGSMEDIEGLISADGHILGKMGHTERMRGGFKNIYNKGELSIFKWLIESLKGYNREEVKK